MLGVNSTLAALGQALLKELRGIRKETKEINNRVHNTYKKPIGVKVELDKDINIDEVVSILATKIAEELKKQ